MTKEEIKQNYSMRDIASRYGMYPNRAGFVSCPFHKGDREASMKIYEYDFHCFGCGANGDIFTFVQMIDGVSFKEAYQLLGGTYEKPSFSSRLAIYKARKHQEMRRKLENKAEKERALNSMLISIYRRYMGQSEPFSDVWCDCYNALQYQLYRYELLNEKR
jgi:DNA primase